MGNGGSAVLNVGRIVDLGCHQPPRLYDCPNCASYRRTIEDLRNAIRQHQAAHEAARSFVDEGIANIKLWEVIG